ncbi:MAG: hypothetical protein ACRCS9_05755 [Hyphomicrobium sp.]
MPPLVFLAATGLGLYAGYKLLSKLVQQAQTPSPSETDRLRREAAKHGSEPKNLGGLEWDEQAGAYKPRRTAG